MENEIKVNEYIRTKDGFIDKIVDIRDTYSERKLIAFEKSNSLKSDIGLKAMVVKHSPNIIDIIEVKDIIQIKRGLYDDYNFIFICSDEDIITAEESIKKYAYRILTHEKFESISYKVKE